MNAKLIVGLGNPGSQYERNRHNVGFRVLDALAKEFAAKFILKTKFKAEIAEITPSHSPLHKGEEVGVTVLAKPQTFMNESGQAVAKILKFYKLNMTDLFIVHDEIDLPFGKMKLYGPGGSAGHKGVDSIIETFGYGFTRLRIGIENRTEYRIPPTDDYVLQNFTPEEESLLETTILPEALGEIKKFIGY